MKKLCIIFFLSCIISVAVLGGTACSLDCSSVNERYLRIHIRAHSDEAEAQAVKYAVRDAVVEYLTPAVSGMETFEKAEREVRENLEGIESLANAVLRGQGWNYGAKASLRIEKFPTRKYGEFVLEEGEYLALIIELGNAEGQNWWCVVYPPLCFAGGANTPIVYKSKILEIIEAWKGK